MDFKKLTDKAKDLVDKRGGTESLKEDAEELKGIASGKGSLSDKAKAAVAAIKEPGDDDSTPAEQASPAATATPAEAERAEQKVHDDDRGKHGHGRGGGHGRHGGGGGRRAGGGRGGRDGDPAV